MRYSVTLALACLGAAGLACSDRGGTIVPPGTGGVDAGVRDSGQPPHDAGIDPTTACPNPPIPEPTSGSCTLTPGSDAVLVRADLIAPSGLLENAHLLIGGDGKIACAACDCSSAPGFSGATQLACPRAVVSPGLINAHDHAGWLEIAPEGHGEERYDHRHEWRLGLNGKTEIRTPGNGGGDRGILWGELRQLMAGTTSINASGGARGLLRNVDQNGAEQEGLNVQSVHYSTFPLRDQSGTMRTDRCNYGRLDAPNDSGITRGVAYTPHISEGITAAARNEFVCLSGAGEGGTDVLLPKTALIHGIGLLPADYAQMAAEGASLIWSPRSNVDLYGFTAQVTIAARAGVRIALGTDWPISGSMSILRELRCAQDLNERNYGGFFTDRQLIDMATSDAAGALGLGDRIGALRPGLEADLAIYDASSNAGYRAVLDAKPADVILVARSGTPLYGEPALVEGLGSGAGGCETIDVCGAGKLACVERDTTFTIAALRDAIRDDAYALFFCDAPPDEPSCIPFRPGEFLGMPSAGDQDGDGIADSRDLCPNVFDPPRPLDGADQADADGDMIGDACDRCPLDAMTDTCSMPDPDDRDGDGVKDAMDNCPGVANRDQADGDGDDLGDACDGCPTEAGNSCTVSVYAIKQGQAMGRVRIAGVVVTATAGAGYFVQTVMGSPAYDAALGARWSGLYVYAPSGTRPSIGDAVDLEGTISDFFGQTQLGESTFSPSATSGLALPSPAVALPEEIGDGGSRADELEAVLVEVRDVHVTEVNPAPGAGEMAPTNAYVLDGALRVDDFIWRTDPFPVVGQRIGYVRGVLRWANEHSKLEPRGPEDLATTPALASISPEQAFLRAGTSGTPFTVSLTRTGTAPISVTLSLLSPHATALPEVTIPAGQVSAPVPITGLTSGTATITASYGGVSRSALLVLYDDATPPRLVGLDVPALITPSAMVQGSLRLAVPAPSTGLAVSLRVVPPHLAAVTSTVMVAADTLEADFVLTSSTSTGTAQLIAWVGSSTLTAAFEVTRSVTRAPSAPGDLLITEIHRNPSGSNEKVREWFELHNPTADTLTLGGLLVHDNSGEARGFTLDASAGSVPPGGYAVIAYSTDRGENGDVEAAAAYGSVDIQLANSSDRIVLIYGGVTLDSVIWATGWPDMNGASICLKAPYGDNDMAASWALSAGTFGSGDRGHPGVASDATNCP